MTIAATRRRSRFADKYDPRGRKRLPPPKGDMNVTPFIDVLLVLLVMIILAVPIKVHETSVDLPTEPCKTCPLNADTNTVFITAQDQLLWNGVEVTPDQLRQQVAAASAMEEQPELRFEPAALASYDRSARTIALIKEAGAKRFAFVGNARHKDFGS
ncbi:biopolymer transporter ExbD [Erythrobacter sp. THAF29]|uniref:ExbD/TolR family protein n=1 Tax=Erythrobacter sp. THAF29 TaxID=2587851 RepID=UPI0012A87D34|nr:biopolymer transporter ExbD [Erythrobacter sp. THAF29]QFT76192.1 Biopolymer transport protein ExbD [Erythrobacter sp. THAF29]